MNPTYSVVWEGVQTDSLLSPYLTYFLKKKKKVLLGSAKIKMYHEVNATQTLFKPGILLYEQERQVAER